jgi:hypothetical protein
MSFFFSNSKNQPRTDTDGVATPEGSDGDGGIIILEANDSPPIPDEIVYQATGIADASPNPPNISDSIIVPSASELYNDNASMHSNATTDSQIKRVFDSLHIQRTDLYDVLLSAELNGTLDSGRLQRSLGVLSLLVEGLKDLSYPQGSRDDQRLKRAVKMISLQLEDLTDLHQSAQVGREIDQDHLKRTLDSMFLQIDDVNDLAQQSTQAENRRQSSVGLGSLCLRDVDALSQDDLQSLRSPTDASPTNVPSLSRDPAAHCSFSDDLASVKSCLVCTKPVVLNQPSSGASLPGNNNGIHTMYSHSGEAFQAVGSFIAEQETKGTTKPRSGLLTAVPAFLGDVARFFIGICSFMNSLACSLISFAKFLWTVGSMAGYVVAVFCTRIYADSKACLGRIMATWASNDMVAFAAGMITTGITLGAMWLIKYGSLSAFNFALLNVTSVMDPILQKGRMIWPTLEEVAPVSNIQEQATHVLTRVIEMNPEPIVIAQQAAPKCLAAAIDAVVVSSNGYFSSNQSLSEEVQDTFYSVSSVWTMNGLLSQMQLYMVLALAFAVITVYQKMSTKLSVVKTSNAVATTTQASFEAMSNKALKAECIQRNIAPLPVLAEDLVRHLCVHDGIENSFPKLDLSQYTGLKGKELKVQLAELAAPTSGTKENLQYRLCLAREAIYKTLEADDLADIATQHNVDTDQYVARCLAEAGPLLPFVAV